MFKYISIFILGCSVMLTVLFVRAASQPDQKTDRDYVTLVHVVNDTDKELESVTLKSGKGITQTGRFKNNKVSFALACCGEFGIVLRTQSLSGEVLGNTPHDFYAESGDTHTIHLSTLSIINNPSILKDHVNTQ